MSTLPKTGLIPQPETGTEEQIEQLVYAKLHQLAVRYMRNERSSHTLQATALVNEAYASLLSSQVEHADQQHFYLLAARAMRRILVDHARARQAEKRGGTDKQVLLTEGALCTDDCSSILALHNAMQALAQLDPEKATMLELRFFAGLSTAQIATLYGVSGKTIERSTKLAKAWLHQAL